MPQKPRYAHRKDQPGTHDAQRDTNPEGSSPGPQQGEPVRPGASGGANRRRLPDPARRSAKSKNG